MHPCSWPATVVVGVVVAAGTGTGGSCRLLKAEPLEFLWGEGQFQTIPKSYQLDPNRIPQSQRFQIVQNGAEEPKYRSCSST